MKRLLYIIVLLIGAGAGAGGMWFFGLRSESASAAPAPMKLAPVEQPIFVDLPPMALPILEGDRVQQMIAFTIAIEVTSMDAASSVKSLRPAISDAILQDLYGALDRNRLFKGRMVDAELLKAELSKSITRIAGADLVKSVLVQKLSQRAL
ncbi:MAG: fliL [Rhodospirillales bacterium]|jgi:flagellar basal body-associated protein FliL|nr:fliL [Rhodospirillales bacterium]